MYPEDDRQAGGDVRQGPPDRPVAAGLHVQRDGGVAAGRGVRGSVRRGSRSCRAAIGHAAGAGRGVLRRPAADAAGGAVRGGARGDAVRSRGRRDRADALAACDRVARTGPGRAVAAAGGAGARSRAAAAGRHRAGGGVPAGAAGARAGTGPRAQAQGRAAAHVRGGRGDRRVRPDAPAGGAAARRRQARDARRTPRRGCSSTITRSWARGWPRRGCASCGTRPP